MKYAPGLFLIAAIPFGVFLILHDQPAESTPVLIRLPRVPMPTVERPADLEVFADGSVWQAESMLYREGDSQHDLASEVYNVMVHSFTPAAFKGIVFLTSKKMCAEDGGANLGAELCALANSWKQQFGGADQHFFYTIPSKALAPRVTLPTDIEGQSTAVEIADWSALSAVIEAAAK